MRKRFGIDIDGTVTCPKSILPYINKAFDMNIAYEDVDQYELTPFVNVSEEVFAKWFAENEPTIYEESPLAPEQNGFYINGKKTMNCFLLALGHPIYLKSLKNGSLIMV